MSRFNLEISAARRRRIIQAGVTILAIVAALVLAQRLHAVSHRYNYFDFFNYYGWWADYSSGGDPWTDQRGLMHGCNYTPVFVEVPAPLSRLNRQAAFWVWQIGELLCLLIAVLLLARESVPPLGAELTIIVLALMVLSRPLMGVLVWGQTAAMLLALLSASWFCARQERPAAAGLLLAFAALFKLFPAAAGGYFLFGRNWRALGWTIGFFIAGVLLTNPVHWLELVTHGLPMAYQLKGTHGGITVLSFVRNSIAHVGGIRVSEEPFLAVWGFTALIDLALMAIAAWATITSGGRADLDGLVFGLWVALALLMSPIAWEYDTMLLLPVYLFGLLAAWQGHQPHETASNIPLIAGSATLVLCIAGSLIKALPHPGFPLMLAAYLGAALIFRTRIRVQSTPAEARVAS